MKKPKLGYTAWEASKMLGLSESAVLSYARRDLLPHRKLGKQYRFALKDIRAFARNRPMARRHDVWAYQDAMAAGAKAGK